MKYQRHALAAIAFASVVSHAQDLQGRAPPPINVAAVLNIDTSRAQVVEAILESGHQRAVEARKQIGRPTDDMTRATLRAALDAIRGDTHKQLESVLSPDELAKLDASLPQPGSAAGRATRRTPM